MANLISYQKPGADGWRYSGSYRCRRYRGRGQRQSRDQYRVERWTGEEWRWAATVNSYAEARHIDSDERE